jgi:hypothetical protein
MRVTHFVADTLQLLTPSSNSVDANPMLSPFIQNLARKPSWTLLNDPKCFQVCVSISLSYYIMLILYKYI